MDLPCSNSYVGQTCRSLGLRHKEHTRYIKTNNPVSAYALHILNNKHEYGNIKETIELLKPCNKGVKMNIWESFFILILQKQNLLIKEKKVNCRSWHKMLRYITKYPLPVPVCSAPHTHTPNQGKSIKLIEIINNFPYNVIFLLYFIVFLLYFILFVAELHTRLYLSRFYHNTLLY